MVLKNLFTGEQWKNKNRLMDLGRGKERGGEMYGKSNMETYITICKTANENLLYGSGNLNRSFVSV